MLLGLLRLFFLWTSPVKIIARVVWIWRGLVSVWMSASLLEQTLLKHRLQSHPRRSIWLQNWICELIVEALGNVCCWSKGVLEHLLRDVGWILGPLGLPLGGLFRFMLEQSSWIIWIEEAMCFRICFESSRGPSWRGQCGYIAMNTNKIVCFIFRFLAV